MVEGNTMTGYICPSCRLLISASNETLGSEVVCPGCSSRIRIPSVEESKVFVEPVVQTTASYAHVHHDLSSGSWIDDLPTEVLAAQTRYLPWSMLVPAFAVGSVLFVSLIVLLFFTNLGPVAQIQPSGVVSLEEKEQVTETLATPTTDEVNELLIQLSQAKLPIELPQLLRSVPDIQAKLANYYKEEEVSFSRPKEVISIKEFSNKRGLYTFRADFEDGKSNGGVVSQNSNKNWVIDWESYVGYCDIEWNEFSKSQPKQPSLVRAIRVKNEYYNHGFSSNEWQSFELSYPNSEDVLIGYARRDSSVIPKLLPIGRRFGAMEVTLKVHYPEKVNDPRLVIIDEVVAGNWFTENPK